MHAGIDFCPPVTWMKGKPVETIKGFVSLNVEIIKALIHREHLKSLSPAETKTSGW